MLEQKTTKARSSNSSTLESKGRKEGPVGVGDDCISNVTTLNIKVGLDLKGVVGKGG